MPFLPLDDRSLAARPDVSARERGDHVHDVAVLQGRLLAAQQPRVLVVHEERQVRTQLAMLVAQTLRKRGVRADQTFERVPQGSRVEGHLARAAGEAAPYAVQKH